MRIFAFHASRAFGNHAGQRVLTPKRALAGIICNCVSSVVVSIWEGACDRDLLRRELDQNYAQTEAALEARQLA